MTIRQPDGTLAQLPIWMTEDSAEAMVVTEIPRLPLAHLRELRLELDTCLSSLHDDSRREGDKHDASATISAPIRSLRAQDATGTDDSVRADEAIATGERALVRNTLAKNNARSSWRSNRRDTRQPGHAGSMTRSTPIIVWSQMGTDLEAAWSQMGTDLEAAWHHPAATAVTRKRIIRVVLREVVACVEDDQIHLLLHWQGGDHTRLMVRKNRRGQTRWAVEPETVELIRACAPLMPDKAIAGMLNRTGKRTGRLNGWTQSRVRGFRNTHGITVYRDGEWAERGEVTLPEAARMLNLSP